LAEIDQESFSQGLFNIVYLCVGSIMDPCCNFLAQLPDSCGASETATHLKVINQDPLKVKRLRIVSPRTISTITIWISISSFIYLFSSFHSFCCFLFLQFVMQTNGATVYLTAAYKSSSSSSEARATTADWTQNVAIDIIAIV